MESDSAVGVSEAVARRLSVRAFLPTPAPLATVRDILDRARRAPSGGNLQPWRVDVLTGSPLEEFKARIAAKIAAGVEEKPQYEVYPPNLWEPHRSYRFKSGEDMYGLLNISRDNKIGRLAQFADNYRFFGAPVGLFFSLDRRMGPPQWSDVGMFMQTVMLLAIERGLDTCPQEAWCRWPETIAEFCAYDENRLMFSGMAMGYRDSDHPLNRLRTDRAPLDDFATFRGFDDQDRGKA